MKIQKSILSLTLIAGISLSLIACSENKKTENITVATLENHDDQNQPINKEMIIQLGQPMLLLI